VELLGMSGSRFTLASPLGETRIGLRLPGLYNVYNAVGAAACCLQLGMTLDEIRRGLESFAAAFGRAEQIPVGDRTLAILLVKNPAGANEVFRTLAAADDSGIDVWMVLNDRIADGRDVSWIWDADFETLAPHASRVVCSGTRAEELALRLKYAGVAPAQLEVVPELERGLDRALETNGARPGGRPLYALPTYTALLELRDVLTSRGHAPPFWE
jgi:lipid II isoglutaminyl synthase (glutamine-hydrolysing)